MKPWRRFGGWRWWTRGGFLYLSFGTEVNWLHIEVGPVDVVVRRRKWAGYDK